MTMLPIDVATIRERQKAIAGQYTCGPRPVRGMQGRLIHPCPFYDECTALPLAEDVLCQLPDSAVGIDTMSEPYGPTGWNFELTVKAKKVIDDPLDWGDEED